MINHSQTLKYDGKKGASKELEADPKVKEAMELAKKKTKKGPLMINLVNFYTVKVSAKAIWVAVTYSVS